MSMRPSFRLDLMAPLPLGSPILGCPRGGAQALSCPACLADHAGTQAIYGPATGPSQVYELLRQRRSQVRLGGIKDGVYPLHLGLAELARAVAGIHLVEDALLPGTAVCDIRIARERPDG